WGPNTVCKVVRRLCYTGRNTYNARSMVSNPARPLGDVTGQIKKTILRPKPQEEWVFFSVPKLIPEELWQKANETLTARGRGRGKQGQVIQALLRNRIFCPRCGLPMVVRREGGSKKIFYHCARHYRTWSGKACGFRKFISARWDEYIWDCVYALLSDDSWVEQQLAVEKDDGEAATRLIEVEQRKIAQLQAKITRVQAGYEEGVYDAAEAKNRINVCQKAIAVAEEEVTRLQRQAGTWGLNGSGIDAIRAQLESLRHRNLESAGFDEKLQLLGVLDIRVYPSEDLKTVRIKSGLGFAAHELTSGSEQNHCGKVIFAPPPWDCHARLRRARNDRTNRQGGLGPPICLCRSFLHDPPPSLCKPELISQIVAWARSASFRCSPLESW
ncbi:MAG: hypothetical protein FJ012_01215, partial [Chloroflexi bacterium]|nr:hypothetical protein [Chloroflexota bacterium]